MPLGSVFLSCALMRLLILAAALAWMIPLVAVLSAAVCISANRLFGGFGISGGASSAGAFDDGAIAGA